MNSLVKVIQEYRNKFIQPQIIERIRHREVNNDFPFSVHNMMRAFINLSRDFFRGFWIVYNQSYQEQLGQTSFYNHFGTPTRMYRYALFLLIGAWLNVDLSWKDRISVLLWITDILLYKIDNEVELPHLKARKMYDNLIDGLNNNKIQSIEISHLAVYLKEYVDFLFLGEHPIGYVTFPPYPIGQHALVLREFSNLTYGNLIQDFATVRIIDIYDSSVIQNLSYDLFRGNLDGIPSYRERVAGQIIVDGNVIVESDQVKDMLNIIETMLQKRTDYYDQCSEEDLEVEQALIYSRELFSFDCLPANIETDIKQSVYSNKTVNELKRQVHFETQTELYFAILEESINTILFYLQSLDFEHQ